MSPLRSRCYKASLSSPPQTRAQVPSNYSAVWDLIKGKYTNQWPGAPYLSLTDLQAEVCIHDDADRDYLCGDASSRYTKFACDRENLFSSHRAVSG